MDMKSINDCLHDEGFYNLVKDIIHNDTYQTLRAYKQHGAITVYEHSIHVAYACYMHRKKHPKKKLRYEALVRAAMLHDYFLYDWHAPKKGIRHGLHGFTHPAQAASNAKRDFNISDFEAKIIRSHMFPLNFHRPPTSREAWLLTLFDKKISFIETLYMRKRKKDF